MSLTRLAVAASAAIWLGIVGSGWVVVCALVAAWWMRGRLTPSGWAVVSVALVAGFLVGVAGSRPPPPLAPGPVSLQGAVVREVKGQWGSRAVVASEDGEVLVRTDLPPAGDWVVVEGTADGIPRKFAGRWVRATVDADLVVPVRPPGPHRRLAAALRQRVSDTVQPGLSQGRALLLGFLVGDTTRLENLIEDDMRRAGLSHLVAVSGSNVALFLAGLMVVAAPIAVFPLSRTILALNGLLVFGALTRWEPSVVRASAMAGLVAVGRFVGLPLSPAVALAVVAGGSVLVEPALADSVGFRLSVAASIGLIAGARWVTARHPVMRLFVATVWAQLAVAPVLLATFGSVPLLSPVANLAAIPLVAVATVLGG
ncbi:MAG: ComEC/Rec2 family competence protein, partial [Acidimicrobiia bacterium]|nr:ComEC/Rec2 family competence protein [Acidimicrobiia bacterium]